MRQALWLMCIVAFAQTPAKELDVSASADSPWTDTGVALRTGDSLVIAAEGSLTLAQNKTVTPDGAARGFRDLLKSFPVNEAGQGALIGRIGSSDTAQPFLVGARKEWKAPRS